MNAGTQPEDTVEAARAAAYGLLARLLARPPDAPLLDGVARLDGDASAWGGAIAGLAAAASATDAAEATREYDRLFIGLERGELVPYASYYRTGFLHDRPLVALRADMAALGIVRVDGVREPEDHVAGMLDIMAGLIAGRFGAAAAPERQRAFFLRHLAPWAPRFFRDLEAARAARFYRSVGAAGKVLLDIEQNAFEMVA